MITDFAKEKVFWTRKMNLKLVKFIESRPNIWNPKHPKYTSAQCRDKTYADFAAKYGDEFTGQAVKERWTNIRSTFANYLRKLNASRNKGDGEEYKINWHLWEPCQFLLKVNRKVQQDPKTAEDDANNHYDMDDFDESEDGTTTAGNASSSIDMCSNIVGRNHYRHGEQWRKFRSKVQRPILQPQTVKKYVTPIELVTEDFIKYMEEARDEHGDLPKEFDNDIHRWSLECIGRVALDTRLGCLSSQLSSDSEPQRIIDAAKYALRNVAVLELKAPYWRYFPTPLWTKYVNNMNFFVELCSKYINEALERLKTKKVTSENDLSLLERVLKSEGDPKIATIMALDLILVGIDTISMAVCSILYQATQRLPQQDKMAEEIRRVLPDPDKPISYADLDKLHYTKAFVREVFRMYSTVIGNGRTLQEDDVICGYHIPKGVQVVFPTIVTGNMEQFVSDPEEFRPERWLAGDGKLHPFASLPYGFGARICLGRRFADLEIQVLLAKLLRRYRLEYHHEPLEYAVTFMYAPDGPLRLRMVER